MKTKIYNSEQMSFFPLYLTTVGVEYPQPRITRYSGYERHQVFLVNSGSGVLNIGGQSHIINKNDLFYIAANIPHEYYGNDDNFKTTFISFCGDGFEKLQKYYNLGNFGVYKNKHSISFEAYAEKLYEAVDTIHELSTLCSLTFSAIISYFDEACKKSYSQIEKAYNFIEENYSKMITLDDILTVYPYSKTKLCRDFKEKYSVTIFETLTSIRLRHAQNMINANPCLTLKNIASSCGFNDVSYFCKMYKRFFGCSPKSQSCAVLKQPDDLL